MTGNRYTFELRTPGHKQDQRTEYRLTGRAKVTIELEAAGPEPGGQSMRVHSDSSDVSAGGMRLTTPRPLPEGALLPAWLELAGEALCFELTVEVIWCRKEDSSTQWQSGLRILDTGDEHYLAWLDTMARLMAAEQG